MIQIEITNKTEGEIDETGIKHNILSSLKCFGIKNGLVEVDLVSREQIGRLNASARHIDKPTDVLSFPQIEIGGRKPHLGSIVISPEVVLKKGEDLESVTKHGLLHLLGFDHEADSVSWDIAAKKINCNL